MMVVDTIVAYAILLTFAAVMFLATITMSVVVGSVRLRAGHFPRRAARALAVCAALTALAYLASQLLR